MEFLALVSLLMIVLAGLYGVLTSKQFDTYEERSSIDAQHAAETIGFELEMALVQGEGYSRVFNLPTGIGGSSYNLTATGGTIVVEYREEQVLSSTRYQDSLSLQVDEYHHIFEVKHNETGVFIVER